MYSFKAVMIMFAILAFGGVIFFAGSAVYSMVTGEPGAWKDCLANTIIYAIVALVCAYGISLRIALDERELENANDEAGEGLGEEESAGCAW